MKCQKEMEPDQWAKDTQLGDLERRANADILMDPALVLTGIAFVRIVITLFPTKRVSRASR